MILRLKREAKRSGWNYWKYHGTVLQIIANADGKSTKTANVTSLFHGEPQNKIKTSRLTPEPWDLVRLFIENACQVLLTRRAVQRTSRSMVALSKVVGVRAQAATACLLSPSSLPMNLRWRT